MRFLPVSREDMDERGWRFLDFLYISGDAYVDHPSFAPALICRLLESEGYKIGILPQPDWKINDNDALKDTFTVMGRPRLGVLIGAGNLDSMLNKLTSFKMPRHTDAYSPGGKTGMRPDRATIVYSQIARRVFGDIPVIIGGVEASLRRFAHYDYWQDSLRRSVLIDSQADILIYGMGERQIIAIAKALDDGIPVNEIRDINGTCYVVHSREPLDNLENKNKNNDKNKEIFIEIPSWDSISCDKLEFARAFRMIYDEQDPFHGRPLIQDYDNKGILVQMPPAMPLTTEEMDRVYELPYMRRWHPMYDNLGGVPALSEVKFSITSHRGCFGSCAFCAIHAHQGRIIQARSHESIISEIKILTELPDFKGYIHDIGGPTANFRHPACSAQLRRGSCRNKQCLFPEPCKNLDASHKDYLDLLRKSRAVRGVKKIFVRSGLRYDYLLCDRRYGRDFLEELCEHHVSGQLKVAPEHVAPKVLNLMRKPGIDKYEKFAMLYAECNKKLRSSGRLRNNQYLVPYFMTSHPGAGRNEAEQLGQFAAQKLDFCPEQVQDFIPTPGSLATCMYYSGIDPFSGERVFSEKSVSGRRRQRALLQGRIKKEQKGEKNKKAKKIKK